MDFGSFNFAVDEWRHGRTAGDELEQGGTGGRAGGPGPFLRRGRMKIKFKGELVPSRQDWGRDEMFFRLEGKNRAYKVKCL